MSYARGWPGHYWLKRVEGLRSGGVSALTNALEKQQKKALENQHLIEHGTKRIEELKSVRTLVPARCKARGTHSAGGNCAHCRAAIRSVDTVLSALETDLLIWGEPAALARALRHLLSAP